MMLYTVQFPIKGTYYYAAELALESDWIVQKTRLILKAEPDNPYDKHAIQIWCAHPDKNSSSELLIGYVPRALAKQLRPYLEIAQKQNALFHAQVIHKAKIGKQIEIDCQLQLSFSWLNKLKIQWLCFWIKQQQVLKKLKNRFKIQ